ncbi:class I SAM-dependent methyltransferase [Streptomyces sp. NPDC051940]|uniref:class I SAM-dependent methyltransferase n=1 Tax=Streptomyces sp. NPDC051940 TaxID=3155675 RepID=UPI003424C1AA
MSRHRWAAGLVAPEPGERLLEIGYGPGLTAASVLEHLGDGRLLGVDRSAKMAAAAARRNARAVAEGRAEFRVGDWPPVPQLSGPAFDKAYAFNVRLLWTDADAVTAVRRVLAPGGSLYVFLQLPPPSGPQLDAVAAQAERTLDEAGFRAAGVDRDGECLCVRGRRA